MLKLALTISCASCIAGAILHTTVALAAVEGSNNAANANAQTNIQPSIQIVLSKQKDSAIRMEIRQAPLGQVLKALAEKTGVLIHYSALPEAPVTATCVGANVGQVMDCLVAKQVGLVAHKPQQGRPAEFWLLGSSVGSCQAVTIEAAVPMSTADIDEEQAEVDEDPIVELMKMAKNKDAAERVNALSSLSSHQELADPRVDEMLQEGLKDESPDVRAQAVASLAVREGEGAEITLKTAMKDESVVVRLAAIDNADEHSPLLKEALDDSDPAVRKLAAQKLGLGQ
ncbi:HEAT repeat domain-containing protein [Methyloglobulus sp.]|uniref:HEAT repeat domain-containing protein n=1 Tax=Methyloglobulus sp. TaxID=2518622 RepID=UPI0032B818D1